MHTGCGSSSPRGPPEGPRRWGRRAWQSGVTVWAGHHSVPFTTDLPQTPRAPTSTPRGSFRGPAHLLTHRALTSPGDLLLTFGGPSAFPLPGPQATGCPPSAPAPAETPVQGGLPCLPAPGPCFFPAALIHLSFCRPIGILASVQHLSVLRQGLCLGPTAGSRVPCFVSGT